MTSCLDRFSITQFILFSTILVAVIVSSAGTTTEEEEGEDTFRYILKSLSRLLSLFSKYLNLYFTGWMERHRAIITGRKAWPVDIDASSSASSTSHSPMPPTPPAQSATPARPPTPARPAPAAPPSPPSPTLEAAVELAMELLEDYPYRKYCMQNQQLVKYLIDN